MWLSLPQTLADSASLQETPSKARPFVVLQEKATLETDQNGNCTIPTSLLGVSTTSKDYLVEGRPHVHYVMPVNHRHSYAMLDSLHTAPALGSHVKAIYTFNAHQRQELADGLDTVLQPEDRFYFREFISLKKKIMPGQVWTIRMATGDPAHPEKDTDALVLLRRGRFYLHDDDYDTRFTPYLVAIFPNGFRARDLMSMSWDDVQISSVHERAFQYQIGQVTPATAGILLNTLRQNVGVAPIEYKLPSIRHLTATLARTLLTPVFMRGGFRP